MRAKRLSAIALTALAAFGVSSCGDTSTTGGSSTASKSWTGDAPKDSTVVTFMVSPEKEKMLTPLVKEFNDSKTPAGGKPVYIEATTASSGDVETKIVKGQAQPTAWSPSSSMWGRLLNQESDKPYVADENPSIVRTPLVIAMWEPMAQALGYPEKKVGFADILKLAQSNQGWAAFGAPQFGKFKLVHTNPQYSTSGLMAVVAEYYAATGKKEGLTAADLTRGRETVKKIEQSIVHYGDTTLFIADQMRKEGPGYASAVAMEEATLLDFNRSRGSQPKLIAIYPEEGTFYSDNPFIVLKAPWVTPAQKEGANAFQKFLESKITPEMAAQGGFRPADITVAPVAPITKENGVDPAQPVRVLGLPQPRVLAQVRKAWERDRKAANVQLVIDVSGSMGEGDRLGQAKSGLQTFLANVAPQDRIGLTKFSTNSQELVPLGTNNRPALSGAVNSLGLEGGTSVYDATADGFNAVRKLGDKDRINAVVVLTDGEDTDSARSLADVVKEVQAQGDSSNQVRVFTIAYGGGADAGEMAQIADASGGKAYVGDEENIEAVYRSISSFF